MAVVWNTDVMGTDKDGNAVTLFKTGDTYSEAEAKKHFDEDTLAELKATNVFIDERRLPQDSAINPKALDPEDDE